MKLLVFKIPKQRASHVFYFDPRFSEHYYFVAPKINDMRILLWAWVILTWLRFMETRRYALNYSHCYTYFPAVTRSPSAESPSNSC